MNKKRMLKKNVMKTYDKFIDEYKGQIVKCKFTRNRVIEMPDGNEYEFFAGGRYYIPITIIKDIKDLAIQEVA